MEIKFAGIPIATGDTALDDVGSLDPKFETDVQIAKYLRADAGAAIPRGNDMATIPVIVTSSAQSSIAAARLKQQAFWGTLPPQGALIVIEGATVFEYPSVAKKTYTSDLMTGVTIKFTNLFVGPPPHQVGDCVTDESGDPILSESAAYIESDP